jgi:hypothetical protein
MIKEGREEKGWGCPGGRGSCSSETLVSVYQTTWYKIPEGGNSHSPYHVHFILYTLFVNILL